MSKILIAVDGSDNASRAVDFALRLGSRDADTEYLVVNVQPAGRSRTALARIVSQPMIDEYFREQGDAATQPALERLRAAGARVDVEVAAGQPAETVARLAREHGCSRIVMGRRGSGALQRLLLGSVANQVIRLAEAPVTLVP